MRINKENIDDWIQKFKNLEPNEANQFSEALSQNLRSQLLGIALDSSKLALTENNDQVYPLIYRGAMSIILEGCIQDPRDSIGMLALLNNSSKICGLDLNKILRGLHLEKLRCSDCIDHWIKRDNKEIDQFGFSAIKNDKGVVTDYSSISFNSSL
ncbi:hypothetical protein [Robiginitalea sp.]|uniref:hypothetical protein n=1 Tax=Robiginitalea sp. TaxID=1902411 RepID=UPI003C676DCF